MTRAQLPNPVTEPGPVFPVAAVIARAPLLASATAAGLCRVDYLEGRWMRDKMPYGGVEGIRKEGDGMDVDGEEDGEEDGDSD